jgi:hypothetical protein
MGNALMFAKMCKCRKTMVLHLCAHRLSVTKEEKRDLCVEVVFLSEWSM